MALPGFLKRFFPKADVAGALERACAEATGSPRVVEIDALRAVIFSDHHRGRGDGADDFERCEQAYVAALGWYLEHGYELWLLGDVEELWENSPPAVLERYANVLALERSFGEGKVLRFFGNHDLDWASPKVVERHLASHLPANTPVREALNVDLVDGGTKLGTLFLVHGHQGTPDAGSAFSRAFSRFVVRNVWARLQRFQRIASTSPSQDVELRARHDRAMARWADDREDPVVLIAGHTHRPVFPVAPAPQTPAERLAEKQRAYDDAVAGGGDVAATRAELELARVRFERDPGHQPVVQKRPAYFNTGCCSFGDGDVTGLVIDRGTIGLVRWLDNDGNARPQQLVEPADLRDILRRVQGRGT
jgi:hypothetical protein